MKNIFKTMLAALCFVACSTTMNAQDAQKAQTAEQQRMSREQMAETQAKHIAYKLGLDDAATKKYVEAFCDYEKEIWALGPKTQGKKRTEMTDAETEQVIKSNFERSEKILSIRQKYYKRYSQFMTQKQISRAFKLEREAMKRLGKQSKKAMRGQKQGKQGKGKSGLGKRKKNSN